jgi:hypothetical protein
MTKNKIINERKYLIQLCKDAVVHHTKWRDRDSYSSQREIQSIYKALTAGLEYRILTKEISPSYYSDDWSLIIEFLQPIDFKKLETGEFLEISSLEDYFRDCDPEHKGEMFDGEGIDFYSDYTQTYMPTRKRLEKVGTGNDWY